MIGGPADTTLKSIGISNGGWILTAQHGAYTNSASGTSYNWYAVGTRNLAPTGWHVSSDSEWTTLINYLDPNAAHDYDTLAGGVMENSYGFAEGAYWTSTSWAYCDQGAGNLAWSRSISGTAVQSWDYSYSDQMPIRCIKN